MHRVRLDELMRVWLETLSRSDDAGVAAVASCALELHDALGSGHPLADRSGAAARYVTLIETLMSSAARPSRTARQPDEERAGPDLGTLASGDLDRFWGQALENLKRHLETGGTPAADQGSPRKPS